MNATDFKSPGWLVGTAAVAAFALLPFWSAGLSPQTYAGGRSRDAEARAVRNSSSAAVMLGEMRTAMSDIMFIKCERYMHSGVACKPHLQREILSVSGAMAHVEEQQHAAGEPHDHAACTEHNHDDDHHDEPACEALIPDAEDDFRGIVGYLERQVKPCFGPGHPHHHTDGQELLPWFRVMTISDPHYLPGYTTGAWWLNTRDCDEALAFIEEGIRNNPDAFQVRLVKGQVLLDQARASSDDLFHPDDATRRILEQALDAFARAGQLAVAQWKAEQPEDTWTNYKIDDAMASMRMHVMMASQLGSAQEAKRLARSYLDAVGEDTVLQRFAGDAADPTAG